MLPFETGVSWKNKSIIAMLANTSFKNPVTPEHTVWLLAQAIAHVSIPRAGSGYSKCNFAKLQIICNLNICKRYILTEGFQPLISVRGCKSSTTLSTKPRRAVMLLQGTTLWTHRICANSFQAAVKTQSNCIKDQSKKRKIQKYFFQVEH